MIKLQWKGTYKEAAQDVVIPGTIEISNFNSKSSLNDLNVSTQDCLSRKHAINFIVNNVCFNYFFRYDYRLILSNQKRKN
jgi:hypothetical protein